MKTSTLNKRIEKLVKKGTLVHNWISNMKTGDLLRPVYSQGSSWKYSSLVDKKYELCKTLDLLKIKYEVGNDALRGGKTGCFVKILTKINN